MTVSDVRTLEVSQVQAWMAIMDTAVIQQLVAASSKLQSAALESSLLFLKTSGGHTLVDRGAECRSCLPNEYTHV